MFASHAASSALMSACCLWRAAPHTFQCSVTLNIKNLLFLKRVLCDYELQESLDPNNRYFVILSAIIYYSWLIRFSFLPSLTLVCLLMVDFSDISAGDWTVHEHVEPQPWAPWHVRARNKVFLRLKGFQQGRRQQQGHQASCEEEVVLSKSA